MKATARQAPRAARWLRRSMPPDRGRGPWPWQSRPAAGGPTIGVAFARALALALALAFGLTFSQAFGQAFGQANSADAATGTCGDHLVGPARQVAELGGLTLVFAPRPWPVPVGQHFALDIAVCAAPGVAVPTSLRVDADMPAHRHGMNYKPTVQALGDGRFVAQGLMFHMPGRWRLRFYPPAGAPLVWEITL